MSEVTNVLRTALLSALLATAALPVIAERTATEHPATQLQTDERVVGNRMELPANFPTDVPLYKGMQSPTVARRDAHFVVRGQSPDSAVQVARQITGEMTDQGWALISDEKTPSEHRMRFSKALRNVGVRLTLEDQVTLVRMELSVEPGSE